MGKVAPYGVYDVAANVGWVSVGIDHDTAEFAVQSIRHWWPIGQALRLAQACARGTRLHLLTHSTGGVVAELLARVCAGAGGIKELLARLPKNWQIQRNDLMALADAVAQRSLRVERLVRIAAPMRGTPLATDRLDMLLSMFRWAYGRDRAAPPALGEFIAEVARRRAGARELPG